MFSMKVLLLALLALQSAFAAKRFGPVPALNKGIGGRIVGGQDADPGEYPWQVSWRGSAGSGSYHSCGGSILNENWVLSAGHCCDGLSDNGELLAGVIDRYDDENGQLRSFVSIIHPNYNSLNVNNDLCLLQVDEPFDFSNGTIGPIALNPNENWESGTKFTVTGWGSTSEGGSLPLTLQEVEIPYVGALICKAEYFPLSITAGMICAGESGKDSCQGDSGGPMVHFDEDGKPSLVGVVSWGIGCARPRKPGVYARVAHYIDWIEETMSFY